MLTAKNLELFDYEVLKAGSGEAALKLLQKHKPDLILLDLLLPTMQGDTLCKQLKSDDNFKHIPIVLFTASANNISRKIAETKADDYIIKPFEIDDLVEKIKKYIGCSQST
jgi:CheY-like chemotaxis protein